MQKENYSLLGILQSGILSKNIKDWCKKMFIITNIQKIIKKAKKNSLLVGFLFIFLTTSIIVPGVSGFSDEIESQDLLGDADGFIFKFNIEKYLQNFEEEDDSPTITTFPVYLIGCLIFGLSVQLFRIKRKHIK